MVTCRNQLKKEFSVEIKKSVLGDEYVVLRPKGETSYIQFVKTGYVCRARNSLIKEGKVFDSTKFLEEAKLWVDVDEPFSANAGWVGKIVARRGDKVKVVTPTGYSCIAYEANVKKGKITDPLLPSYLGVGIIGVPDKSLPYYAQAKQLWSNMIKRCYSDADTKGYYGRCFVDDRWKCFENFLIDISKLNGFEGWVNGKEIGIYYNLDKDFLFKGNDTYSRYTCCFLPESFNKSLGKKIDWFAQS